MNATLVKIAMRLKEGKLLQEVADEMGVELKWVEQVVGTHGFLVVKEKLEQGDIL